MQPHDGITKIERNRQFLFQRAIWESMQKAALFVTENRKQRNEGNISFFHTHTLKQEMHLFMAPKIECAIRKQLKFVGDHKCENTRHG